MQGRRSLETSFPRLARRSRGCWARGLTLIELFVVIAILAALFAILMPVVATVRRAAMNAVCTARLHELTYACNLYRFDNARYPRLTPEVPAAQTPDINPLLGINLSILGILRVPGLMTPEDIQTDLLNSLGNYLRFPAIAADSSAADLPPGVQCPTVEDEEVGRETMMPSITSTSATSTTMTYYTGYVYVGRLGEGSPATVHLLRPDRPASTHNSSSRGVLWADDVHYTSLSGGAWKFAHRRPNVEPTGPLPLSYESSSGLAGQHRAYTDGSVEWIDGSSFDFDDRNVTGGGERATLEISTLFRWWF